MGWAQVRLEVVGHVSSHNSDQDAMDDAMFEEFCSRVTAISKEHRYRSLALDVMVSGR